MIFQTDTVKPYEKRFSGGPVYPHHGYIQNQQYFREHPQGLPQWCSGLTGFVLAPPLTTQHFAVLLSSWQGLGMDQEGQEDGTPAHKGTELCWLLRELSWFHCPPPTHSSSVSPSELSTRLGQQEAETSNRAHILPPPRGPQLHNSAPFSPWWDSTRPDQPNICFLSLRCKH